MVDVERHRDEAIEVILPGIVGVVQSELEGDPLMDEVPDTLPLDTSEGRRSQAAARAVVHGEGSRSRTPVRALGHTHWTRARVQACAGLQPAQAT